MVFPGSYRGLVKVWYVKENNMSVKEDVLLVVASNDATLSRLRSTKI